MLDKRSRFFHAFHVLFFKVRILYHSFKCCLDMTVLCKVPNPEDFRPLENLFPYRVQMNNNKDWTLYEPISSVLSQGTIFRID